MKTGLSTVFQVVLIQVLALLASGCTRPDQLNIQYHNGTRVELVDWYFHYEYISYVSYACSPTRLLILDVQGKDSQELHVLDDDGNEVVISAEDLESIEYWFTEYAPFPLEANVRKSSGELYSFGQGAFEPPSAFLSDDPCVDQKRVYIKGTNVDFPYDDVLIDLINSMLSDPWAEPFWIDKIEVR